MTCAISKEDFAYRFPAPAFAGAATRCGNWPRRANKIKGFTGIPMPLPQGSAMINLPE